MKYSSIVAYTAAFSAIATVVIASPSRAAAITSFSDNFDAEGPGDRLNYETFANWDVSEGTVDLIGAGGKYDLFPGNGSYVDLDGSTRDAGVLTTKDEFAPGTYALSFFLGGASRTVDTEEVSVVFGSFSEVFTVMSTDPLALVSRTVSLSSAAKLSFANAGGDYEGAILDNVHVQLSSVSTPVPTPALIPGLIGCGLSIVRKKRKLEDA